jgi:membrane-associated protein
MNYIFNIDLETVIHAVGYIGIFAIIFAESGLFIGFFLPGDTLLFTTGILASQGYFSVAILALGAAIAAILGDQTGYLLGRKFGPKIFNREESLYFKKKYLIDAENFYKNHGKKTVIIARFVPIVRAFVPMIAGAGKMDYKNFVSYNIIGGLVWGGGITLAGYFLGQKMPDIDKYLLPILFLIVVVPMIPSFFNYIYKKIKK